MAHMGIFAANLERYDLRNHIWKNREVYIEGDDDFCLTFSTIVNINGSIEIETENTFNVYINTSASRYSTKCEEDYNSLNYKLCIILYIYINKYN